MRRKKPDLPPDDDGRVIAPMNVEGMPWYTPERRTPSSPEQKDAPSPPAALTREEYRFYTWGALKAALLVVGILCGGIVLFILFCQFVWFRS